MNLWNDNEEGVVETLEAELLDMYKNKINDEPEDHILYDFSKYMESYCWEVWLGEFSSYNFNKSTGPIYDFVNSSWKMINWYEIAEAMSKNVITKEVRDELRAD